MNLTPGDTLHKFTVLNAEPIEEIDGTAYTMRHDPSGARLLYIANNDVEKSFGIGFKTPPTDNTGVFHIIEHSVLCGSERFPVKEPFVQLLKTSMNTFLNAMTFPDKTIYPVSSTNETDLINLADVYMDAVLHPLIYEKREVFEQEGWHLETATEGDAPSLVYNGIVYNEMKGSLADPEDRLLNALDAALFPDIAYGHDSGGTPECIPTLSYEAYLDAHRRHYSLRNSYLYLYGDLDADRFLAFLDENYLSPEASRAPEAQGGPNPLEFQKPVRSCGNTVEIACDAKQCGMALGYGAGRFDDYTRLTAIDVLLGATMGDNEAPLRRALLDAGLAEAVNAWVYTGLQQPYVCIVARGINEDTPHDLRRVLEENARRLASGELDRSLVEAALSNDEFTMREVNYGSTNGLSLYRRALESWLYDDTQVTENLRFEETYKELRELLDQGYFEQLLRELFCENPHTADVVSVPVQPEDLASGEADVKLADLQRTLDADGFADIDQRVAALREKQEAPDSPQALATLPRLALDDLGSAPQEPACRVETHAGMRVLRHDVNTRGIVYTDRRYDAMAVSYDELPYLGILAMVYGKLDTTQRSASDLSTLIDSKLGKLEFSVDTYEQTGRFGEFKLLLGLRTSSLETRVEDAARISHEVMTQTVFDDRDRLKRLLVQRLERMERGISSGSLWAVTTRAQAYYLPGIAVKDALAGIEFFRFLKELVAHFDERYDALVAKLVELSERFYANDNCVMSFVGTDDALERFLDAQGAFGGCGVSDEKRLVVPELATRNEAFATPADVMHTALFYDHRLLGCEPAGSWSVARKALSYDYLWNEVRVKGGAYGGSFELGRISSIGFRAWRDPHLQRSIDCFKKSAAWLAQLEPTTAQLEGYIISAIADMDMPKKPYQWARDQLKDYLEGYTPQMKQALREQAIATTPQDLRAFAGVVQGALDAGTMCTSGSRAIIERSTCGFTVVDVLGD